MDINVDQGSAKSGLLGREYNGKYLYRLDSGKFDIDKFNRDFDQYKDQRKEEMRERIDKKISELNKPVEQVALYDLSIGQIMINMKDAIFNIIDDLLNFKISKNVFIKQNRLFYIGIFIILIAIILYLYMFFINNKDEIKSSSVITHVHEIKLLN
jgi:hypothetical protein